MSPSSRHAHGRMSSEDFLNAEKILSAIDLQRGQTVLDVGCSEGHFSLAASNIVGERGRVFAVDIHTASINILRRIIADENVGNVTTFAADVAKHIPVADNAVDVCLMINVLHGFVANHETAGVMREIARVLRRHGMLVIVDFKKADTVVGPPMSLRLSPVEVEEECLKYGFAAESLIDAGPYSYQAAFIKK